MLGDAVAGVVGIGTTLYGSGIFLDGVASNNGVLPTIGVLSHEGLALPYGTTPPEVSFACASGRTALAGASGGKGGRGACGAIGGAGIGLGATGAGGTAGVCFATGTGTGIGVGVGVGFGRGVGTGIARGIGGGMYGVAFTTLGSGSGTEIPVALPRTMYSTTIQHKKKPASQTL